MGGHDGALTLRRGEGRLVCTWEESFTQKKEQGQRRDEPVHLRVGKEDTGLGRRSQGGLRPQGPLAAAGCGLLHWER